MTGRVVAILDAVAAHVGAMSLAQLTRETGLPKPTARRIAADLVDRRLLERGEDGYRLGSRLLELGLRAAEQQGLRVVVAPYVQDLYARTGEIAWVNVFGPTQMSLVDIAFARNRYDDWRRTPWPHRIDSLEFGSTAVGRVLLAERPEAAERYRERRTRRLTPYTTTSWTQIDTALQQVRDTGAAVEHQQVSVGYSCVATALRDTAGDLIGAIGVTGRAGRLSPERITRALLSASTDISLALAHP